MSNTKRPAVKVRTGQIAILSSHTPSRWSSCKVITPNLQKAYGLAFPKANLFNFYNEMTKEDVLSLAEKIKASQPSAIVLLDHLPHPYVLYAFFGFLNFFKKPKRHFFHLYGDFTLFPNQWKQVGLRIKNLNATFICPSPRQQKMIQGFTRNLKKSVAVCPFPVDSEKFYYDQMVRKIERANLAKTLKLGQDDFLIIYTGRLSQQKNILALIKLLEAYMATNRRIQFCYAGLIDDMGEPYFGRPGKVGSFAKAMETVLGEISPDVKSRIRYLGNLDSAELLKYYNAADLFISLSTHHDEDYGMSPLEALFCGCPVLLSNWGGYAGFDLRDGSTALCRVNIRKNKLSINKKEFSKALTVALNRKENSQTRLKRSKLFQKTFSIEAVAKKILSIHRSPPVAFRGFNKLFDSYVEKYLNYRKGEVLYPKGPSTHGLYFSIYRHYLGLR